ncbi:MAG: hypothetical protein ACXWLL_01620, partial [Myxococcaceae bacterium]
MNVLTVYLRIYADAFRQALTGIAKNAWTLLLPIALLEANGLATGLVIGTLGRLGQFVVWAVWAAAASCYLYFLGEVVAKSRVKLDEFGRSVGAYFWSVANLFFVYWVATLVIDLMVPGPQKAVFSQLLFLAGVIVLNAAPEVMYQRGTRGGLETVQRSVRFLQANWIEWGIPNLLILAAWWFTPRDPLWSLGTLGTILTALVEGALLHLVMVFRGHLFAALDGTSHRQRM